VTAAAPAHDHPGARPLHIVVIPGTNRAGSLSLRLAQLVAGDYRRLGCGVDLLELQLTPEFLAPTAYKQPAPAVSALVGRFLAADGVVFIVPEYNGSYPGVLKLFIDMLPYPQGFDQRPCAFIGLASGQFQGLRAVEHLQGVAGYRNAHCYPGRVFIGGSHQQFDAAGALSSAELATRLVQQAAGFHHYIGQLARR
jgi:chromate reductase